MQVWVRKILNANDLNIKLLLWLCISKKVIAHQPPGVAHKIWEKKLMAEVFAQYYDSSHTEGSLTLIQILILTGQQHTGVY